MRRPQAALCLDRRKVTAERWGRVAIRLRCLEGGLTPLRLRKCRTMYRGLRQDRAWVGMSGCPSPAMAQKVAGKAMAATRGPANTANRILPRIRVAAGALIPFHGPGARREGNPILPTRTAGVRTPRSLEATLGAIGPTERLGVTVPATVSRRRTAAIRPRRSAAIPSRRAEAIRPRRIAAIPRPRSVAIRPRLPGVPLLLR